MTKKKKILYVDDEIINLKLFDMYFRHSYDVFLASNGPDGLKILEEQADTVAVITDMNMPDMTGLEFVEAAKMNFPNVLFYILTGFAITDEIQLALNKKLILSYFSKPIDFKDIASSLESAEL